MKLLPHFLLTAMTSLSMIQASEVLPGEGSSTQNVSMEQQTQIKLITQAYNMLSTNRAPLDAAGLLMKALNNTTKADEIALCIRGLKQINESPYYNVESELLTAWWKFFDCTEASVESKFSEAYQAYELGKSLGPREGKQFLLMARKTFLAIQHEETMKDNKGLRLALIHFGCDVQEGIRFFTERLKKAIEEKDAPALGVLHGDFTALNKFSSVQKARLGALCLAKAEEAGEEYDRLSPGYWKRFDQALDSWKPFERSQTSQ